MYRSGERALLVTEQLAFQKIEGINMDVWPSGMSRTQYRLINYACLACLPQGRNACKWSIADFAMESEWNERSY